MKTNPRYFFLILFYCGLLNMFSQVKELPLSKASAQLYNKHLYVFGLSSSETKKTNLYIYKLGLNLVKKDSAIIELGKNKPDDFLLLASDTLHNFLNIYLQQKEKKLVRVLRYDTAFKQVADVDDIDVVRLNSISAFEREVFYYNNEVFTVKHVSDTSGKQFYLNKYTLKSADKNFEYEQKWQFPFERKNIHSAHVIYANKYFVLMYVTIVEGSKRGQWLLKVNTQTGLLLKGIKINSRGDAGFYTYGSIIADTSGKIILQGQKLNVASFDQKANKIALAGRAFAELYIVRVDSMGDVLSRDEFKIPITTEKPPGKIAVSYILRTTQFSKDKEGDLSIEADVYVGNNGLCFSYANTAVFNVTSVDEFTYNLEKASIGANQQMTRYYTTPDKLDMTGRLCADSISEFERLFYKNISSAVKLGYRTDDMGNPTWLLKKDETKKNSQNYSTFGPVKKIYQLSRLTDVLKDENPLTFIISNKQFILSRQIQPERFQLQVFNW